jgi:GyrI-like small molecule binding domain
MAGVGAGIGGWGNLERRARGLAAEADEGQNFVILNEPPLFPNPKPKRMTPLSIVLRKDFSVTLHGFSGYAQPDWATTGKQLMDQLWKEVRARKLASKGINFWVYEEGNQLFTGVELTDAPPPGCPLESKTVTLSRYAYHKHIGPYDRMQATYKEANKEFEKVGIRARLPIVEIYGHWNEDPSKLETELLWSVI